MDAVYQPCEKRRCHFPSLAQSRGRRQRISIRQIQQSNCDKACSVFSHVFGRLKLTPLIFSTASSRGNVHRLGISAFAPSGQLDQAGDGPPVGPLPPFRLAVFRNSGSLGHGKILHQEYSRSERKILRYSQFAQQGWIFRYFF